MKDMAAIVEQGKIRHEQHLVAATIPHPFTPHARDNQCDVCAREPELPAHTGRQLPLWRLS